VIFMPKSGQSNTVNLLAQNLTRQSSLQTYWTIKLLVDRPLVNHAFKAYAYFRWLDDQIDQTGKTKVERQEIINHHKKIIHACYSNRPLLHLSLHEQLLSSLIASDPRPNSKLHSFITNFFAIIEFDAKRQGKPVSQTELSWYTDTLAKAVTDGIEHFVNHHYSYPDGPGHYRAAIGAHLTHMLRDLSEDYDQGYFNLPSGLIKPYGSGSPALNQWVKTKVKTARNHFYHGKNYIRRLPVLRGKLAASWYCCRFEAILTQIESDHYRLRPTYRRRFNLIQYLNIIILAVTVIIYHLLTRQSARKP
jgi:phytoene/squalene synthetase